MASSNFALELDHALHAERELELELEITSTPEDSAQIEQRLLPPTDGGKQAWLVLAGCSLIQAPVWGFSLSFGVFQDYYTTHDDFQGDAKSFATIGTSVSGILYLSSPILFTVMTWYPRMRTYCGPAGLAITVVGLLLSSFADKVWQLIATQGVLCGIGTSLLFSPTTLNLDEWWIRRKGVAYGIMWGGKSSAGVGLPLAMSASLSKFGFQTTIRAWAIITLLLTAPLIFAIKPRLPLPQSSTARPLSTAFLRLPSFWVLQTGNVFQSLGYFLPSTFLAAYASQTLGLSTLTGTLLISILNGFSIFGGIIIGALNDHFHVTNVILISSLGSTLAIFLFWGLASQMPLLILFAGAYGFFAGSFSSTWSGMLNQLKAEAPSLDTGFMFGLLAGGRGIGNVISGPLSEALIGGGWQSEGKIGGYGTEYGPMILFTGISALLGGCSWAWRIGSQLGR